MMLRTQETLDGEIIVDSFAGGGGASTGIELAPVSYTHLTLPTIA